MSIKVGDVVVIWGRACRILVGVPGPDALYGTVIEQRNDGSVAVQIDRTYHVRAWPEDDGGEQRNRTVGLSAPSR